MTGIYLLVNLIVLLMDNTEQVVEGINIALNSNFSGMELFWWGLFLAFLLDVTTGSGKSD